MGVRAPKKEVAGSTELAGRYCNVVRLKIFNKDEDQIARKGTEQEYLYQKLVPRSEVGSVSLGIPVSVAES